MKFRLWFNRFKLSLYGWIHPFKEGFWCIMNISHFYGFGMLWESWDSYAGDGDYGYEYFWANNRKTTKQLIVEYPHCIFKRNDDGDDTGFDFVLPFFIAWLLVLPGTICHNIRATKAINDFVNYCYQEGME